MISPDQTTRLPHVRLIAALLSLLIFSGCRSEQNSTETDRPVAAGTASSTTPADASNDEPTSASPLPEDLRRHVWDVEHYGFVLEATVFPDLKAALRDDELAAWENILADPSDAEIPQSTHLDFRPIAGDTGQFAVANFRADDRQSVDGAGFVSWLRTLRSEFDECSSSLGLVRLVPDEADLQAGWMSVWRLRLAGRNRNGPIETEVELELRLSLVSDDIGERSGWVQSITVLRQTGLKANQSWFEETTADSGLNRPQRYDNWTVDRFVPNTGGAYVTDFDGDGHLDVFVDDFADGNRLYRGRGDGTFEDVTEESGIDPGGPNRGWTLSCWADLDSDGDDDLIVEDRLYENLGNGRFRDVTDQTNLPLTPAAGYAVGDYNVDGRLDLYVCHTSAYRIGQSERSKVKWIDDGLGIDNVLLRNLGDWQFQDVTEQMQAGGDGSSCFAAVWLHANDDHRPDLFAINEFGINSLLLSQPDGPFVSTDVDPVFGGFSMGVAAGDYDNNGRTDLYVANMYSKAGNRILANVDPNRYPPELYRKIEEGTRGSKLYRATANAAFDTVPADDMFAYVGWAYGPTFADFDNDGWLDIYATAGFKSEERGKPDG